MIRGDLGQIKADSGWVATSLGCLGLIHGSFELLRDIWGIFQAAPGGVRPLSVELGDSGASSGGIWGLFQAAWGPFWGVWDKPQQFGAGLGGFETSLGGFGRVWGQFSGVCG